MSCHYTLKVQNLNIGAVLFMLILIFQYSKLSAQNGNPDSLTKEQIQYIQNSLELGKPAAKLWWNGWLYGYSAATVGQGIVFLASNELKTRQDMALGAATTFIGAAGQLLMPMDPMFAPDKLARIPGDTPEARILKLQNAEELFEASAAREKEGRSWKMHAISGAVNVGSGLVTWLGFDRTISAGLWNFALNTAITETQIWTQPTRAIKDYKQYCEKYKSGVPQASDKLKTSLFVNAIPGGVSLRLVF
jgi:hypothetical protein